MVKFIFISLCFILMGKVSNGQTLQREGLMNLHSGMDPENYRRYVWFQDSVVIFEIFLEYSESFNDSIVDKGICIRNYSLFDLKTMRAQDYLTFSDTAKPLTNYLIKEDESLCWNFYAKTHPYDRYTDSLKTISDTTMDGKQFKRYYFDISGVGWHQRVTYYLFCSPFENIFHMSRKIDNLYPGCKVTCVQYQDIDKAVSSFNKIFLLRDNLTITENKIFEKWKANLDVCTLPITTHLEAQKYLSAYTQEIYDTYHR